MNQGVSGVTIDWASATVKDARLIVELKGEIPSRWKQSFKATARLLGGGEWGRVRVKKKSIDVDGVAPGSEEKLRHFLESVVEQANADHEETDSTTASEESDGDAGPDAEMTQRFRSFAGDESPVSRPST